MVGEQRKVADPLFFANAQPHYDQSEKHRAVRQRSHSDTITVDQRAFQRVSSCKVQTDDSGRTQSVP